MRPKLIFSNYKFRCPAKRAGPPLESKWKCEKIASIRAFVRMKREKEGYDISERADNYLNNPETRASSAVNSQSSVCRRLIGHGLTGLYPMGFCSLCPIVSRGSTNLCSNLVKPWVMAGARCYL